MNIEMDAENQHVEDLKALITELADALEEEFGYRPVLRERHPWNLIERAREATK